MKPYYTEAEYLGGIPVFLVEIEWGGMIHRMANFAVTLSSDDGDLNYTGGLQDFQFKESADLMGQDLESNLVSLSVIFDDIDLLLEWSKGNVLEGQSANFSYVIWKEGRVQQSYENRILLFSGKIQEPQFGDPLDDDGSVSFSIEAEPIDENRLLLNNRLFIDQRFGDRDKDTADGKPWPIVLGTPGELVDSDGNTKNLFCTPAYCIDRYSGVGTYAHFMIAGHQVAASQIVIQDDSFQSVTKPVLEGLDANQNVYSYVKIDVFDVIAIPGGPTTGLSAHGTSRSWWVNWDSSTGGGLYNNYGSGLLENGGDLCRWALNLTGQKIDDGAWANVAPLLNKYKFSGYINDPDVGAWEWLAGNILPFLPVSVRSGPRGLKPVLNQLHAIVLLDPLQSISIGEGEEFQQITAIETIRSTAELFNKYTLNYGKVGYSQDYSQQCRVSDIKEESWEIPSDYSILSINRYGVKESAESSDYIFDISTANSIALQKVRSNSLPVRSLGISAKFHYGYFQIGDIIEVTSSRLYLTKQKMLIAEKEWSGSEWIFTLIFEDNPIQNKRS